LSFANSPDYILVLGAKKAQGTHVAITHDTIRIYYENRPGHFSRDQRLCAIKARYIAACV
jgi:hypothetical protein